LEQFGGRLKAGTSFLKRVSGKNFRINKLFLSDFIEVFRHLRNFNFDFLCKKTANIVITISAHT
jgi:hypothetical protein